MMAVDEEATLADLKEHRNTIFDPGVDDYNGRIIKLMGDGTLAEFSSVMDAVQFGLDIQTRIASPASRVQLRIGIHLGDVMLDGEDIYGNGLNVAARLEALAPVGGLCISSIAHESLGRRNAEGFTDMGEHRLKNPSSPVRLYCWSSGTDAGPSTVRNDSEKLR